MPQDQEQGPAFRVPDDAEQLLTNLIEQRRSPACGGQQDDRVLLGTIVKTAAEELPGAIGNRIPVLDAHRHACNLGRADRDRPCCGAAGEPPLTVSPGARPVAGCYGWPPRETPGQARARRLGTASRDRSRPS